MDGVCQVRDIPATAGTSLSHLSALYPAHGSPLSMVGLSTYWTCNCVCVCIYIYIPYVKCVCMYVYIYIYIYIYLI